MDPTEAELQAITDIAGARNWAGVNDELWDPLRQALGDPARVREIVLVNRPTWDRVIATLKLPGPPPAGGGDPPLRDLSAVESARIESFRRVCFLRLGQAPDHLGGVAPAPPVAAPAAVGGGPPQQPGGRKLKLSAVLDPTLDAEVQVLPQPEVAAMYEDYKKKFGDYPTADSDISIDQLSALAQVVRAGAAPFACFSLFGPFGQRLLRRQTFTSYQLSTATGEWQKKEQPGPADYHAWHQCYKVFRTGMLLLQAAEAERIDAYGEHIRSYVTQFTEESWWLVARADHRLRSEHLDRLRRELRSNPQFGFSENDPWGPCFAMAVKDSDFWHKELTVPATLWLARSKSEVRSRSPGNDSPPHPKNPPGKKRKRANRHFNGPDQSRKGTDGRFTHNRRGVEICRGYGRGKCGTKAAQGKCQNGRSHQCDICLGPHMADECPNQRN